MGSCQRKTTGSPSSILPLPLPPFQIPENNSCCASVRKDLSRSWIHLGYLLKAFKPCRSCFQRSQTGQAEREVRCPFGVLGYLQGESNLGSPHIWELSPQHQQLPTVNTYTILLSLLLSLGSHFRLTLVAIFVFPRL